MSNSIWKCQKSSVFPISVGPDASAIGAGAVLLQKDADTDDDLVFFTEM